MRVRTSPGVVLSEKQVGARQYVPTISGVVERVSPISRAAQSVAAINASNKMVYTDGSACGRTSNSNFVTGAERNGNRRIISGRLYR